MQGMTAISMLLVVLAAPNTGQIFRILKTGFRYSNPGLRSNNSGVPREEKGRVHTGAPFSMWNLKRLRSYLNEVANTRDGLSGTKHKYKAGKVVQGKNLADTSA